MKTSFQAHPHFFAYKTLSQNNLLTTPLTPQFSGWLRLSVPPEKDGWLRLSVPPEKDGLLLDHLLPEAERAVERARALEDAPDVNPGAEEDSAVVEALKAAFPQKCREALRNMAYFETGLPGETHIEERLLPDEGFFAAGNRNGFFAIGTNTRMDFVFRDDLPTLLAGKIPPKEVIAGFLRALRDTFGFPKTPDSPESDPLQRMIDIEDRSRSPLEGDDVLRAWRDELIEQHRLEEEIGISKLLEDIDGEDTGNGS